MTITLLDLLGPQGADAVVQSMAERRIAHLPGSAAEARHDLFPVDDMESFLLRDGVDRSLSVMINGRPADLDMMGVLRKGRLRPLALRKLLRQGASLVLNDLERFLAPLWELACDAERRLRDRVRILAVGSFSRMPVYKAHYDPWDLIVIQIEGSKSWTFLGEPADCGVPKHRGVDLPAEVTATLTMQPGDVLFVPAGLHHQCEAEGFSLHLSLVIERATLRDVVDDLFARHPSLNRPLRAVLGKDSLARQVATIRQEIVSHLGATDAAQWLADWNGRRGRLTRLDLRGDAQPAGADAVASLALTMVPDADSETRWKVGGAELEPTPATRAVLQALSDGPRTVRELIEGVAADTSADDARQGLDLLVDKGIVRLDPVAAAEAAEVRPLIAPSP